MCQIFSYTSVSFTHNGTCNKGSLFAALDARLSKVETELCIMETKLLQEVPPVSCSLAIPEPGNEGGKVVFQRKRHHPFHVLTGAIVDEVPFETAG